MATETVVHGLPELKRRLERLPKELARKALRKGVAAGAGFIRRAAQANAPSGKTGTLKRATIIKYMRKDSNDNQQVYIVTFRKGKRERKARRDAYYASWVEFGHRTRGVKGKAGAGFVQGSKMLTRAFNQNGRRAVEVIKQKISAEIPRVVSEL